MNRFLFHPLLAEAAPAAAGEETAVSGAAIGMFMMKTIQQCLVQGSGFSPGFMTNGMGSPGRSEKRKKQMYSLVGVACLQPLLFWYLSRV